MIDLPGLAMSRSIGDTMAKGLGVTAEPEINIINRKINQNIKAIVLASDGLWDVIDPHEICKMIS